MRSTRGFVSGSVGVAVASIVIGQLLWFGGTAVLAQELERPETSDYIIGVEDVLGVSVWQEEELSLSVNVRPDGKVTFPLVGDVVAAGRTPSILAEELTESLKRYIKDPVVTVIVEEINHFKVFVLGEVNTQGVLQLRGRTRLLEALALAGGLTEFADKSNIVLVRYETGKERRRKIDYRKVVNGGRPELNVYLKPGDTIIVN
jgi:polysaccharide export outer membrane protein